MGTGARADGKDMNQKDIQVEASRFRSASPFMLKLESS